MMNVKRTLNQDLHDDKLWINGIGLEVLDSTYMCTYTDREGERLGQR